MGARPLLASTTDTVAAGRPLVSLEQASVRYGDVQALAPLSLTVRAGERIALVGANGSGKTTLLRALGGAIDGVPRRLHATAGAPPPVTAMVAQKPFLISFSARWNVQLALWLQGVPRAGRRARADAALARVGLQAHAGRSAPALSGGQQQRLALARAWAMQPALLLLDEPTASLDPSAKREVERLLASFADDGVALVMSTHNLGQAKRLATRVVCLDAGVVVADRPVDAFFNEPLPDAAAAFLRGELPWS